MDFSRRLTSNSWVLPVCGISALLATVTFVAGILPETSSFTGITNHFTLSYEMNAAVWWSSLLFLIASLAAVDQAASSTGSTRIAWGMLAGLFAFCSLDELGSLHERIGRLGWSPYLPFAIIVMLMLMYVFRTLLANRETRSSAWILLVGFACLAFSPLMEFVGDEFVLSPLLQVIRSTLEEGAELTAAILFLIAPIRLRKSPVKPHALDALLLTNGVVRALPLLLAIGAAAHVVGTVYAASFTTSGRWGDPSAWYPSMAFAALGLYAVRQALSTTAPQSARYYLANAAAFVLASPAAIYLMSPRTNAWIPYVALGALLLFPLVAQVVYGLGVRSRQLWTRAVLALILFASYGNDPLLFKLDTGIVVFGLCAIFLWLPPVIATHAQPAAHHA